MENDFTPQPEDTSICLPITFDYRGGRSENKKGKIILGLIVLGLEIILLLGISRNENISLLEKVLYDCIIFYIGLFIVRFFIFKELYFSDIYEGLLETNFELGTEQLWQIFDVDLEYPYTCYFRNGVKGIYVRMERGVITGKPETAVYDHYEAISDAYNIAHSLNMNIVNIDYMDTVGNDSRLQYLYNDLMNVENEDMQEMLIDIYSNLQDEMSRNYAIFDVYLFLTRDKPNNFIYNVQQVVNTMLGGNYITYKILNRQEVASACSALFNLHEFSLIDSCEKVLAGTRHSGIIPISITHEDGTVEEINKTIAEKKVLEQERQRKLKEQKLEAERKKKELRNKNKGIEEPKKIDDSEIDLFSDNSSLSDEESNNTSDDINLF